MQRVGPSPCLGRVKELTKGVRVGTVGSIHHWLEHLGERCPPHPIPHLASTVELALVASNLDRAGELALPLARAMLKSWSKRRECRKAGSVPCQLPQARELVPPFTCAKQKSWPWWHGHRKNCWSLSRGRSWGTKAAGSPRLRTTAGSLTEVPVRIQY